MPDIPERQRKEDQIAGPLWGLFRRTQGDARTGVQVNWDVFGSQVASIVQPTLEETFAIMLVLLMMQDETRDQSAVTQFAREASSIWSGEAAAAIGSSVGNRIKSELADGRKPPEVLTRRRAESIAITQVTQAGTLAEDAARKAMEDEGVDLLATWNAINDSKTCIVCRGLDGLPESEWRGEYPSGPPAHPNCRCFLDYEVI